jgi:hypothetical protein
MKLDHYSGPQNRVLFFQPQFNGSSHVITADVVIITTTTSAGLADAASLLKIDEANTILQDHLSQIMMWKQ